MSRVRFTDRDHVLDNGKPLWPPRDQPSETDLNIWAALDVLTEKQKAVVEMRYFGEWTFKEIGAKLGISKQAAHSVHDRAMEALKEKLK